MQKKKGVTRSGQKSMHFACIGLFNMINQYIVFPQNTNTIARGSYGCLAIFFSSNYQYYNIQHALVNGKTHREP